ncbi:MAG: type III pantothenate kinase [Candidatus Omnitrophota bacterium]
MIVIDIGNTNIHFTRVQKEHFRKTSKIPSGKASITSIKKILSKYPNEKILAVSVVPKITKMLKRINKNILIAGENVKIPIKCLYNKKNIGMDRLVGAYAAKIFFPGARLILDFGTAITLDVLSKNGAYQGGFMLPGIGSTLKVFSNCALLPKHVEFKKSKKLIPQNTSESISKGVEEGFSLMINSLIEKYKKKLKIPAAQKVIITGGDASVILPKLNFPRQYEPNLVIKGLIALTGKI